MIAWREHLERLLMISDFVEEVGGPDMAGAMRESAHVFFSEKGVWLNWNESYKHRSRWRKISDFVEEAGRPDLAGVMRECTVSLFGGDRFLNDHFEGLF